MENVQKFILNPLESETPNPNPVVSEYKTKPEVNKKAKGHPLLEKYMNMLIIGLKLGRIDAFDENWRIKNKNGVFIDNSNLINLLTDATTVSKLLLGEDDFINLLFKAKIEPSLILNENVKTKLLSLYETKPKETEQLLYTKRPPLLTSRNKDIVENYRKRRRELEPEEEAEQNIEPPAKKQTIEWIEPDSKDMILEDDENWE